MPLEGEPLEQPRSAQARPRAIALSPKINGSFRAALEAYARTLQAYGLPETKRLIDKAEAAVQRGASPTEAANRAEAAIRAEAERQLGKPQ